MTFNGRRPQYAQPPAIGSGQVHDVVSIARDGLGYVQIGDRQYPIDRTRARLIGRVLEPAT
jgi:hypothetical protein